MINKSNPSRTSTTELRFTDPAFACEVVLSGIAKCLYEKVGNDFERLKELKSLGLTSHLSHLALHHRHQHLVGMMRIFNKLYQQQDEKGLPKKFLWSFWCRLCFSQTGHAALSYDSEKAVLLACQIDPSFKEKFQQFISPVTKKIKPCSICKIPCEIKKVDDSVGSLWFEDLISKNQWDDVHLWVAALKLIKNKTLLSILLSQNGQGTTHGFAEAEAFKILIAPNCHWADSMERLNSLDFVVRDLAYAGTLGIQIDIDGLVAAADDEHKDWDLLQVLKTYLQNNLYENIPEQTSSVLYQRLLADLLIRGRISLENLFGLDSNSLNDSDLLKIIEKTPAGKDLVDPSIQNAWKTWPIQALINDEQLPCEIEAAIVGKEKSYLLGTKRKFVTCVKLHQEKFLGVALCHKDDNNRPSAKAFVSLCEQVQLRRCPNIYPDQLTKALFEGLFDRTCNNDLKGIIDRLASFDYSSDLLKNVADVIKKQYMAKNAEEAQIAIRFGSKEYPLAGGIQSFQIHLMIESFKGPDNENSRFGMSALAGKTHFWYLLLNWQSKFFGHKPSRHVISLIEEAQRILACEIERDEASAARDLEIYTFLESLKHPDKAVSFRIAVPNLIIVGKDGQEENEFDVVSIVLENRKEVVVRIWGVTTGKHNQKKIMDDKVKIKKLRDILAKRWGGEVRAFENYINIDRKEICCDIDGKQTRRRLLV